MSERIIFHIDVNSAFLSWEAEYRIQHLGKKLDLRTIPSAVGGDLSKRHGIILAKSIPAKAYGIYTGEPIPQALRKCPQLVLAEPNYELYEKNSRAFLEILREYTELVEPYSIDEAFMDMTGTQALFGPPVQAACALKDRIYRELGFTVNVGISTNKLLAKMAGELRKPNLVHTLYPWEIQKKMWPLPVGELFFVGHASVSKLHKLGIYTIGDLAQTQESILVSHMKKHGKVIRDFANGLDVSVVEPLPPANKGYGNSTTIAFDVCDSATAGLVLLSLSETVAARLRKDQVKVGVVSVSIKYYDLSCESHQMVLKQDTDITNEIYTASRQLFDELWNGTPIRHLGIHTSRVSEADNTRQLSLFDKVDYEKLAKLDQAVDNIRKRYGADAIMRASFAAGTTKAAGRRRLEHMSGGIPKERRRADYSSLKQDL